MLLEHPAIAEAAAIPYPSPLGEDDVRVVAERCATGAELTPEELVEYCVSRMPDFMVPRYVEFLPSCRTRRPAASRSTASASSRSRRVLRPRRRRPARPASTT